MLTLGLVCRQGPLIEAHAFIGASTTRIGLLFVVREPVISEGITLSKRLFSRITTIDITRAIGGQSAMKFYHVLRGHVLSSSLAAKDLRTVSRTIQCSAGESLSEPS